ncbi:hypothetical protein IB234_23355 [Pseudomonas sp. PDM16]|uniref:hypothetical protein n=1 Tax=Pseudomonas sp. PDM16 TaxID=2769292 RepID=UPI0017811874|nr:hypothetical protein [Pseudomonas sp. PDM16]MBD9417513.1 hypothetical protein [Pseudomonas sp. PDM16]
MDEKIATELSDQIVIFNRRLSMIIGDMKESLTKDEYAPYLNKLSHMLALSFDVLDMLGNDYPHLNPYENGTSH